MDFTPETFGQLYADEYDDRHRPASLDDSVELISAIAGLGGRILELASGTGRIALPLAARGHVVEGIEGSPEMVAKMRAKPGGADIPVTIGDMAEVGREGPFDHVCLVFNTLFNLTTQEAQVQLFRNVAARLRPGGTFLIEAFVPDFSAFSENQRTKLREMDMDRIMFEMVEHDPVLQRLNFQRVRISQGRTTLSPLVLRYARPPELDLMAQLAGLRPKDRWGGWRRERFTAQSPMHVTVYERPA